jgi:hypothetical protein
MPTEGETFKTLPHVIDKVDIGERVCALDSSDAQDRECNG